MKNTLRSILAISLLIPNLSWAKIESPDIIIDSKLDFNWSEMLVHKIRRLMVNQGLGDPFKSSVIAENVILETAPGEFLSPDSKELLSDLGGVLGLNILNSKSKIIIKNYQYEVGSVTTDLKTSQKSNLGLVIEGDFAASDIKVVTDEIRLVLEIPSTTSQTVPLLEIVIKKPFLLTQKNKDFTFGASVQIIENEKDIKFKILKSDFAKMAHLLALEPESVQIGFEDIVVPEITVRIGNQSITIDPKKVKNFVAEREHQLKALLVDQLRVQLQEGAAEPFLKMIEEQSVPREHWINTDSVASLFSIGKISSSRFSKNLEVSLPADFCTKSKFDSFNKNCINLKDTKTPSSVITESNHLSSLDEIKDTLNTGDANLVASISEDYVNKLLAATFDAGFYDETLKEAGASLGTEKAFVRLDEKGDTGTLYADVIYKISGFQGFAIGRKEIRFPLVVKISIRFEKKIGGIPVLIIKLNDADLSDSVLRYGIPELNLVSTIQNVPRFKGKVIKTIREAMVSFVGQDVLALDYPEFKGLGLETVHFTSDGNGRLGAKLRLEELLQSTED